MANKPRPGLIRRAEGFAIRIEVHVKKEWQAFIVRAQLTVEEIVFPRETGTMQMRRRLGFQSPHSPAQTQSQPQRDNQMNVVGHYCSAPNAPGAVRLHEVHFADQTFRQRSPIQALVPSVGANGQKILRTWRGCSSTPQGGMPFCCIESHRWSFAPTAILSLASKLLHAENRL
jgi:hypothetical protein